MFQSRRPNFILNVHYMTTATDFNTQDVSEGRPNLILNIHYMTTTTAFNIQDV